MTEITNLREVEQGIREMAQRYAQHNSTVWFERLHIADVLDTLNEEVGRDTADACSATEKVRLYWLAMEAYAHEMQQRLIAAQLKGETE